MNSAIATMVQWIFTTIASIYVTPTVIIILNLYLLVRINEAIDQTAVPAIFHLFSAIFELKLLAAPPSAAGYSDKIHEHLTQVPPLATNLVKYAVYIHAFAAFRLTRAGWSFDGALLVNLLVVIVGAFVLRKVLDALVWVVQWMFPEAEERRRAYYLVYKMVLIDTMVAEDMEAKLKEQEAIPRELASSNKRSQWTRVKKEKGCGAGAKKRKETKGRLVRDLRK